MRCQFVRLDTQVRDRGRPRTSVIRRRRVCLACTSVSPRSSAQLRELGDQAQWPPRAVDRDKLLRSVQIRVRAAGRAGTRGSRSFPRSCAVLEPGRKRITSETIGETDEHLRGLDDVAYVRFVCVPEFS
jgi:transcriptional regulator NrdR family protein